MTIADQATPPSQSILIADCGSVNTTAALFDVAAGRFRLIGRATVPTTAAPPYSDITAGIRQAIAHIAEMTGRELLSQQGALLKPARSTGTGVDRFAAVVSAAAPLSVLLVGLYDDVSMASARRVMCSSYVNEVASFSLADHRSDQARIATFIEMRPELVFLVGGTDGGAEKRMLELLQSVSLGVDVLAGITTQRVIFAGNKNLRERVRQEIGNKAEIHVAKNVRPTLETEQLLPSIEIIENLYQEVKIKALPGIKTVDSWSDFALMPTAQAFASVVEYFAALQKTNVVGVDLGSSSSTFILATPETTNLTLSTRMGTGAPVANILSEVELEAICRWIPAEVDRVEVNNFIENKQLFPQTVPVTEEELRLEQAVAREVLRCLGVQAARTWQWPDHRIPPFGLLLARGGVLTNVVRPGQSMHILLDALQPWGLFSVALDQHGVLPALGSLARHDPLAAVQALEGGVLVDLGWVVAPKGRGQPGQRAIRVVLESEEVECLEIEVEYGSLEVLPLPSSGPSNVTLQPEKRFDIGFGPGKEKKVNLHGGAVGLVIDARGRPLPFPADEEARLELVRKWHWDMGG